jgi:hypothetical protein
MKKRGNACGCAQRLLSQFPTLRTAEMAGLRYEDDVCFAECDGHVIRAYSYEIISGIKYRSGECIMIIW